MLELILNDNLITQITILTVTYFFYNCKVDGKYFFKCTYSDKICLES